MKRAFLVAVFVVTACGKHLAATADAASDADTSTDAGSSDCAPTFAIPGWSFASFDKVTADTFRSNLHKSDSRYGRGRRAMGLSVDGALALELRADGTAELRIAATTTSGIGSGGNTCTGPGCEASSTGLQRESVTSSGIWRPLGACTAVVLGGPRDAGPPMVLNCTLASAMPDAGAESAKILVCATNVKATASRGAVEEFNTARFSMNLGAPPKQWMLFGDPIVDVGYQFHYDSGSIQALEIHR